MSPLFWWRAFMLSKLTRYLTLTDPSPDGTQFPMIRTEQIVLMPSDGGYYRNNSAET